MNITVLKIVKCIKTSSFITSNPEILMGKPTIIVTRLAVDMILEKLAAGQTEQQLLEDYPRLTHEAILAVLQFSVIDEEFIRIR